MAVTRTPSRPASPARPGSTTRPLQAGAATGAGAGERRRTPSARSGASSPSSVARPAGSATRASPGRTRAPAAGGRRRTRRARTRPPSADAAAVQRHGRRPARQVDRPAARDPQRGDAGAAHLADPDRAALPDPRGRPGREARVEDVEAERAPPDRRGQRDRAAGADRQRRPGAAVDREPHARRAPHPDRGRDEAEPPDGRAARGCATTATPAAPAIHGPIQARARVPSNAPEPR